MNEKELVILYNDLMELSNEWLDKAKKFNYEAQNPSIYNLTNKNQIDRLARARAYMIASKALSKTQ